MENKSKTITSNDQAHDNHLNSARSTDLNSNPYDSENLDNEPNSESKDLTEQDIENDFRNMIHLKALKLKSIRTAANQKTTNSKLLNWIRTTR
ncbi:hypothetical protein [Flavobacterium ustbae]|uniref:hypothetical protein n=1 Tax=Flavobacterium ustbae TaxID=2488790 RepID=UPI000F7945AD|nr:hypothetical protein [Flavobacterium ustbae]